MPNNKTEAETDRLIAKLRDDLKESREQTRVALQEKNEAIGLAAVLSAIIQEPPEPPREPGRCAWGLLGAMVAEDFEHKRIYGW